VSRTAKAYVALVIVSGTLTLLLAAGSWSSANMRQFVIYLGLAAIASALKVHIPGMEGTISPNFVFLLLGMVALPFSQVAVISLIAALVQSLWTNPRHIRLVQVTFAAATLVVSSSIAFAFSHFLTGKGAASPVVCVILAGSIYLPVNAVLVAVVIGLVEGQAIKRVCQRCFEWVFPYFMVGIAFAGLVSGAYARSDLWKGALVLLPTMVLTYVYFLNRAHRALPAMMLPSSTEEEYAAEVHS